MRVLITGASGLLGKKIFEVFSREHEVTGTCLNHPSQNLIKLDLTSALQCRKTVIEARPELVIHAAGLTDVDACEKNPDLAFKINVEGTRNLLDACRTHNSKIIFISTDFVFDGKKGNYTESDLANPEGFYAKTKLLGEQIILQNPINAVARVAVLYGAEENKKFVCSTIKKLKNCQEVNTVSDWIRSPTLVDDIAYALIKIKDLTGIYHLAGSSQISFYEIANEIANIFNLRKDLIKKIPSKNLKLAAKRPLDSSLSIKKIEKLGIKMHSFMEGLTIIIKTGG